MITPRIYATLDAEERQLWHSHVFEVKSGMLIMPAPQGVPDQVWEVAENKEMEEVVELYGNLSSSSYYCCVNAILANVVLFDV